MWAAAHEPSDQAEDERDHAQHHERQRLAAHERGRDVEPRAVEIIAWHGGGRTCAAIGRFGTELVICRVIARFKSLLL